MKSKVEINRKSTGRPKGIPKTGGRVKGTPNKRTISFTQELEEMNFSLAEATINLFITTENDSIKLQCLELIAKHSLPIPKAIEVTEDPEETVEDSTTELSNEELLKIVK